MKLVATSDFRNPDIQRIDVGNDKIADLHIHKGARFEIGEGPFEKLSAADKKLVAALNAAGRIVEASQAALVKQIDDEVAAQKASEKKRAEAAAKLSETKK